PSTTPPPPRSALFPYTTLFRSPRNTNTVNRRAHCADGPRPVTVKVLDSRLGWHKRPAVCYVKVRRYIYMRLVCPRIEYGYFHIRDRKSTRLNSSHSQISYAVFC